MRELLLEITRCPVTKNVRESNCLSSDCHDIVWAQNDPRLPVQVPEPWSGDLTNADLLFVGSNPSIDYNEHYPDKDWPEEEVVAFFEKRFATWIQNDKTLQVSGHRGPSVPYLKTVRELAGKIKDKAEPGKDYAVTEAVHCKSKKQDGVGNAVKECRKYLNRILECSGARVFIILGAVARDAMRKQYPEIQDPKTNQLQEITVNGRLRLVLFLPHPNAHLKKDARKVLEANKVAWIATIRARLDLQ